MIEQATTEATPSVHATGGDGDGVPNIDFSQGLTKHSFIHSFISGMHHYECIVPNVDINLLQTG